MLTKRARQVRPVRVRMTRIHRAAASTAVKADVAERMQLSKASHIKHVAVERSLRMQTPELRRSL